MQLKRRSTPNETISTTTSGKFFVSNNHQKKGPPITTTITTATGSSLRKSAWWKVSNNDQDEREKDTDEDEDASPLASASPAAAPPPPPATTTTTTSTNNQNRTTRGDHRCNHPRKGRRRHRHRASGGRHSPYTLDDQSLDANSGTPPLLLALGTLMEGAASCHIQEAWTDFWTIVAADDEDDDDDDDEDDDDDDEDDLNVNVGYSTSTDRLHLGTSTTVTSTEENDHHSHGHDQESVPSVSRQSTDQHDNTTTMTITGQRRRHLDQQNQFVWWTKQQPDNGTKDDEENMNIIECRQDDENEEEGTGVSPNHWMTTNVDRRLRHHRHRRPHRRTETATTRGEDVRDVSVPLARESTGRDTGDDATSAAANSPSPTSSSAAAATAAAAVSSSQVSLVEKQIPTKKGHFGNFLGNVNDFVDSVGNFLIGTPSIPEDGDHDCPVDIDSRSILSEATTTTATSTTTTHKGAARKRRGRTTTRKTRRTTTRKEKNSAAAGTRKATDDSDAEDNKTIATGGGETNLTSIRMLLEDFREATKKRQLEQMTQATRKTQISTPMQKQRKDRVSYLPSVDKDDKDDFIGHDKSGDNDTDIDDNDAENDYDDDFTCSTDEGSQADDNEEFLDAIADLVDAVLSTNSNKARSTAGLPGWLRRKVSCFDPNELRNDDYDVNEDEACGQINDEDKNSSDHLIDDAQCTRSSPRTMYSTQDIFEGTEPETNTAVSRSTVARRTVQKWIKRSLKTLKPSDNDRLIQRSMPGFYWNGNPNIEVSQVPIVLFPTIADAAKACDDNSIDSMYALHGSNDVDNECKEDHEQSSSPQYPTKNPIPDNCNTSQNMMNATNNEDSANRVGAVGVESSQDQHLVMPVQLEKTDEENELLGIETILGLYGKPQTATKQRSKASAKRRPKLLSRGIRRRGKNSKENDAIEQELGNASMRSGSQLSSVGILSIDSVNTNILDRFFTMETSDIVSKDSHLQGPLCEVPSQLLLASNRTNGCPDASSFTEPPSLSSAPSIASSLQSLTVSKASSQSSSYVSISDVHLNVLAEALGESVYVHIRTRNSHEEEADRRRTNNIPPIEVAVVPSDNDDASSAAHSQCQHQRPNNFLGRRIANLDIGSKTELMRNLTKKLRRSQLKRLAIHLALSYQKAQNVTQMRGPKTPSSTRTTDFEQGMHRHHPGVACKTTTLGALTTASSTLRYQIPIQVGRLHGGTSIHMVATSLPDIPETE